MRRLGEDQDAAYLPDFAFRASDGVYQHGGTGAVVRLGCVSPAIKGER